MPRIFLLFVLSLLLMGPTVFTKIATWDPSTEPEVTGYYLYWKVPGDITFSYKAPISKTALVDFYPPPSVDLTSIITVTGYYNIVVTTRDVNNNESDFSNQIDWTFIVVNPIESFNIY